LRPDPLDQTNVLEFEKNNECKNNQIPILSEQNVVNKESNKTRKRNLNKQRKDKLKRIKNHKENIAFK